MDRTVKRFWSVVTAMSPKEKAALLRFVTSCERPPPLGFESMQPPFCVHRVGIRSDGERLPTASTCFNTLKLPTYSTEKVGAWQSRISSLGWWWRRELRVVVVPRPPDVVPCYKHLLFFAGVVAGGVSTLCAVAGHVKTAFGFSALSARWPSVPPSSLRVRASHRVYPGCVNRE